MEYYKKHKKSVLMFVIALAVILISSFFASLVQSAGFSVKVTDLRNETNSDETAPIEVSGKVASGILFMPNDASAKNQKPAVVLTHGYLNNRELQLQNAIELARRGFIVLTIDREGHGNYENSGTENAMMATNGLYDSAKYLYNLPETDRDKIGISGHSMGGFTTAMTLASDASVGIISAGLMQGWSTFISAGADVSVGNLKAKDDEFFYDSTFADGSPSISREFLQSKSAASFVGVQGYGTAKDSINIKDGGIYVDGHLTSVTEGAAVGRPFRAIYESNEIHPLNHFSTESASSVVNFFYNAFGTPNGDRYIASGNQTWWVKEAFSTIGLAAFFFMIIPAISLLLTLPCFASLKKEETQDLDVALKPLAGVQKHVSYWAGAVACTLFSGFSIFAACTEWGTKLLPQTRMFPQDQTGWVASWAVVAGLFALAVSVLVWIVNMVVNRVRYKENASQHSYNPFAPAKISAGGFGKSLLLAFTLIVGLYLLLWIVWGIWTVDFRFWTFDVKVFNINMIPMMLRYSCVFFIFYAINALFNTSYRVKNLPEWATIAINAFFNVFGIVLVMAIQYITFGSTGVLWQSEMALGYIVLFPIVPVLIIATILSRILYKKTGNIWLGALINTILFTVITCANTASSFFYI